MALKTEPSELDWLQVYDMTRWWKIVLRTGASLTGNKTAKSVRYIIASLVTVPDEEYFFSFCLFEAMLYVSVNTFSIMTGVFYEAVRSR